MGIRAVIWDFGGVIMRTEDRAPRQQLAARLGMSYEDLSRLIFDSDTGRLATVGKITTREHWETVRTILDLSSEEFPAVPDYFWGGDHLDMGLIDTIRALRPRYKTALLSNAWDDLRPLVEGKWQIADAFDALIISAEVGVAKPAAEIYHFALARLGMAAGEAVFIDDFLHNIEAARALGMQAIQFYSPEQALADLGKLLKGDQR